MPCEDSEDDNDCQWSYEQGTSVRAEGDCRPAVPDTSFVGWSEPECGTSPSCTVKVDDDLTSVVAVFTPLMLAVTSRTSTAAPP